MMTYPTPIREYLLQAKLVSHVIVPRKHGNVKVMFDAIDRTYTIMSLYDENKNLLIRGTFDRALVTLEKLGNNYGN
jgi:hypothetical protein